MAVGDTASLLLGLLLLCHTWGAWAVVVVNMEDRVDVYRGQSAQITCMFTSDDGIGGMTIKWFYVKRTGERQKIYTQDATRKDVDRGTPFTDRISVNGTGSNGEVVLTINDVRVEDELEFICSVDSLTDGSEEGRTKLKVFDTPDLPTIRADQTVFSVSDSGPSKIGVCEVRNGYPKPNITWYRNATPLRSERDGVKVESRVTAESSKLFSVVSELSLHVRKEDKDAQFYCEVNYFVPGGTGMTETTKINITVIYPSTAVSVWVESPKGEIKEGDSIEFHCQGNGNAPSDLTMMHKEVQLSAEANVWVRHNVTRQHSGVYTCELTDMETYEVISGNTTVMVNYLDPAEVIPRNAVLAQGEKLTATCNALSSLQTHTSWSKDGREISRGHTLSLEAVTFDTAGTYVCEVTVPDSGMETSGSLHVKVQGPPEITTPDNTEIEESLDKSVDLSCSARGFPAPDITWTTSDGKVLRPTSQEQTEDGVQSAVSVKVTSDITAFCNATNKHGADAVAFTIKAIKAATALPPKKIKKEGSGVIIAVLIICILLLAILGSVLYYLYKKGKICGRSGKQDLTNEKSNKDNIVVEVKSDNTEEAILLGVNGEKLPPSDQ